jgi:hypothetical protein
LGKFLEEKIKAPNLSGYYHAVLFEFIKYYKPGKNLLLVGEPLACKSIFTKYFDDIEIDIMPYEGEKGCNYLYDLNVLIDYDKKYDLRIMLEKTEKLIALVSSML